MLRRIGLACCLVLMTALSLPGRANAGGWWSAIELENSYLAVGQTVEVETTEFLFRSVDVADHARQAGDFDAYLLAGFDFSLVDDAMTKPWRRGWWKLGTATAIRVGDVELSDWDANLASARASLDVPDLRLGRYVLMFCDAGCLHPLGDLVPTEVILVADPLTASLALRLDRLQRRLVPKVKALRGSLRRSRADAADTSADLREMEATVGTLQLRLRRLEARPAVPADPANPWLAFLGWFVAGAGTALLVVRVALPRRRDPVSPIPRQESERVVREAEKLLSGQR